MKIEENNYLEKKDEGYLDSKGRLFSFKGGEHLNDIYESREMELNFCPFCDAKEGVYERVTLEATQDYNFCGVPMTNEISSFNKTYSGEIRCKSCEQEIPPEFFNKKVVSYENL